MSASSIGSKSRHYKLGPRSRPFAGRGIVFAAVVLLLCGLVGPVAAAPPNAAFLQSTNLWGSPPNTNLNQTTWQSLRWYTNTADTSAFYDYSNTNMLTVKQAGDYFIALTLPLTYEYVAGNYRSTVRAVALVNGVTNEAAFSESSFVREFGDHNESSDHFGLLLNGLSDGDTVEIRVRGYSSATPWARADNACLYAEYISENRTVFGATAQSNTVNDWNDPAERPVVWNQTLRSDTGFTLSNGTNITLGSAGAYLVYVNIPLETSGGIRNAPELILRLNGSYVPGGRAAQGYMRNNAEGNDFASLHFSGVVFADSDNMNLVAHTFQGSTVGDIVNTPENSKASVFIEKIDTNSNFFVSYGNQLEGGATDWAPEPGLSVEWTNTVVQDLSVFEHEDTGADKHKITVLEDGDYLVVYNDYLTESSSVRPNPVISVHVNGSPQAGAQAKTHYIRNNGGHDTSSAALTYLLAGLSSGDVIEIDSAREPGTAATVDDGAEAMLMIRQLTPEVFIDLTSFNVDGGTWTDAEMASGILVTGRVQDAENGIQTNANTPYYLLYNATGTIAVASNKFANTPTNGGAKATSEAIWETSAGAAQGDITTGAWTAVVGALSMSGVGTESNFTFTVTDDDTTGPDLTGFTFSAAGVQAGYFTNDALGSGIIISGQVAEASDGLYTNGITFSLFKFDGTELLTNLWFTNNISANGDTNTRGLWYQLPTNLYLLTGAYTVQVWAADYDHDRPPERDGETVISNFVFTIEEIGPPRFTDFNIDRAALTDGDLAAGYGVTGMVRDIGSGITNVPDKTPYLYIKNPIGTVALASNQFDTAPATLGARAAPETLGEAPFTPGAADLLLGVWTCTVGAADCYDPQQYATSNMWFTVTDDDTNAPSIYDFNVTGGVFALDANLNVQCEVADYSGVYYQSNRLTLYDLDGSVLVDNQAMSGLGANGEQGGLLYTISGAHLDAVGVYTGRVIALDYDVDRPGDSLWATNFFTFEIAAANRLYWGGGSSDMGPDIAPVGGNGTWNYTINNWVTNPSPPNTYQRWVGGSTGYLGDANGTISLDGNIDIAGIEIEGDNNRMYTLTNGTIDWATGALRIYTDLTTANDGSDIDSIDLYAYSDLIGNGPVTIGMLATNLGGETLDVYLYGAKSFDGDIIIQPDDAEGGNNTPSVNLYADSDAALGAAGNVIILTNGTLIGGTAPYGTLMADESFTLQHTVLVYAANQASPGIGAVAGETLTINNPDYLHWQDGALNIYGPGAVAFGFDNQAWTEEIGTWNDGILQVAGTDPWGSGLFEFNDSGTLFATNDLTLSADIQTRYSVNNYIQVAAGATFTLNGEFRSANNERITRKTGDGLLIMARAAGNSGTSLDNSDADIGYVYIDEGTVWGVNTSGSALGGGAVVVSNGAALGGTGFLEPLLNGSAAAGASYDYTVYGTIEPGTNSAGTLTFDFDLSANDTNELVFMAGSDIDFDLGTDSDLIRFSRTNDWIVDMHNATLQLSLGAGFDYGNTYVIFTNTTYTPRRGLLAEESFDYSAGNLIGQSGGVGWGGSWASVGNAETVSGTLSYTGVKTNGNKGSTQYANMGTRDLDVVANGAFAGYIDANGNIGADGTTLWMAMLADDNGLNCRPLNLFENGTNEIYVWDSGASGDWQLNFNGSHDSGQVTTGGDELLVLKIEFGAGDSDTVRLWVNPTVANGEPANGTEDCSGSGADASFDAFGMAFGGSFISFGDEIRFGTTFEAITGDAAAPQAAFADITGYATNLYNAVVTNAGQAITLSFVPLGSLPYLTNVIVDGDNEITDGQMAAGTYSMVMEFYAEDGIVYDTDTPVYDILNTNDNLVATNVAFSAYTFTAPTEFRGTNSSQPAVGQAAVLLGTNTLRWTAESSNGMSQTDQTTLSNGTEITFTVVDDDVAAPALTGFAFDNTTNDILTDLTITGLVQDAGSGIYGTNGANGANGVWLSLWQPGGIQLLTNVFFDNAPAADGSAQGTASSLTYTIAGALLDVTGIYTVRVQAVDYDVDRADDSLAGTGNYTFEIIQSDMDPPDLTGFNVDGGAFTDADLAGGLLITGRVQDVGNGVNVDGNTPYFMLINATGIVVDSSNTFANAPADGGAQASDEALYDTAAGAQANEIPISGTWTATVGAADEAATPNATVSNFQFTVSDDDTAGPDLSGFNFSVGGAVRNAYTNDDLGSGIVISGRVEDAVSGVYTSETYFSLFADDGTELMTHVLFTNNIAGDGDTDNRGLWYQLPTNLYLNIGVYTVRVWAADYDDDRGLALDSATSISNFVFSIIEIAAPIFSGFNIEGAEITDGTLAGAGYSITGLVWDIGSGITNNDDTPYLFVLNSTGFAVVASNKFDTAPDTGDAMSSPEALAEGAFTADAGSLPLGVWTCTVGAADNYTPQQIATSNYLFTVIDDDTNAPDLYGFALDGQSYFPGTPIDITGLVEDAVSGLYTSELYFSLLDPTGGTRIATAWFTNGISANGDTDAEGLAYRVADSEIDVLGVWTVRVWASDYDTDRGIANDKATVISNFTFTVTEVSGLMAHEPFTYDVGDIGGANGGTGWTNAWSTNTSWRIVDPGTPLIYSNDSAGILNYGGNRALSFTGGSASVDIVMRGATNVAGDVWFSFLARRPSSWVIGYNEHVTVGRNDANNDIGTYFGRLSNVTPPGDLSGARAHGNDAEIDASAPTVDQTYFLVGKLEWSGGAFTVARTWVNPTHATVEQAVYHIAATNVAGFLSGGISVWEIFSETQIGAGEEVLLDELRIGTNWASVVPTGEVTPPDMYGFNISGGSWNDAEMAAGIAITGVVEAANFGIVSNANTPYFILLNSTGGIAVASNRFTVVPAHGDTDPGTVSETIAGITAADITVGSWTGVVGAASLSGLAGTSNFVFTVTDDDTNGPDLIGFTLTVGGTERYAYTNDGLQDGIVISGRVVEASDGLYTNQTYLRLLYEDGTELLGATWFTNDISGNGDTTDNRGLWYKLPTNLYLATGTYTVEVRAADYDSDRLPQYDYAQVISNYVFSIIEIGPPIFYSFNVDGTDVTDAQLAGGFTVTGLVQDIGSGITNSPTSPYYLVLNPTGATVVASNKFDTAPDTGDAMSSPEALADIAFTPPANELILGVWTAYVGAADCYNPQQTTESNMWFNVVDDDTNGPALTGFTFDGDDFAIYENVWVTGLVQDADSGIYYQSNFLSLWAPDGDLALDDVQMTNDMAANGDAKAAPEALRYMLSTNLFDVTGVWTVRVLTLDYDNDRPDDGQWATNFFTFIVRGAEALYWGGGSSDIADDTAVAAGDGTWNSTTQNWADALTAPNTYASWINASTALLWVADSVVTLTETIDVAGITIDGTDHLLTYTLTNSALTWDSGKLTFFSSHTNAPAANQDTYLHVHSKLIGTGPVDLMQEGDLGNDDFYLYWYGSNSFSGDITYRPATLYNGPDMMLTVDSDEALGNRKNVLIMTNRNPVGWGGTPYLMAGETFTLMHTVRVYSADAPNQGGLGAQAGATLYVRDEKYLYGDNELWIYGPGVVAFGFSDAGNFPYTRVMGTLHIAGTNAGGATKIDLQGGTLIITNNALLTRPIYLRATAEHYLQVNAGMTLRWEGDLTRANDEPDLNKTGDGLLIMGKADGYTGCAGDDGDADIGRFDIREGTVWVTNTSGSGLGGEAVTVSNGAALGGTGILSPFKVTAAITNASYDYTLYGDLEPGVNGAGTLTFDFDATSYDTNELIFMAGSELNFDVGTDADLIRFTKTNDWLIGTNLCTLDLNLGAGFNYDNDYVIFTNVTSSNFTFADITGYDTNALSAELKYTNNTLFVSFVVVGDIPYALNYLVDGDNQVSDAQMTGGTYTVVIDFYAKDGLTNNAATPNYDVLDPDNLALITDLPLSNVAYIGATELRGTNELHTPLAAASVILGTNALRWTAETSNGVSMTDYSSLSNGNAMTFVVYDDDEDGPDLTGFAFDGQSFGGDVPITGLVQDVISGIYGTNDSDGTLGAQLSVWRPDGVQMLTNAFFTNAPADDGSATAATPLAYTIPSGLLSVQGIYTVSVQATDFDIDRTGDAITSTSNFTFSISGTATVSNDGGASNITRVAGTLNAILTAGGVADMTIYWGTWDGGTDHDNWEFTNVIGEVTQSALTETNVSGLTPRTFYYYRAYVTNASSEDWANSTEVFIPGVVCVDTNATGGRNTGRSWTDAYLELTNALAQCPDHFEIWVAAGDHYPGAAASDSFVLGTNNLYGGFTNGAHWTERDWQANGTSLEGELPNGTNVYHIMEKDSAGPIVVDGFEIIGGRAYGAAVADQNGAALWVNNGLVTMYNCQFNENFGNQGGAVYIASDGQTHTFTNCTFTDNRATNLYGGAIRIMDGHLYAAGCTFTTNKANASGGAIYLQNGGDTIQIVDSVFEDNIAVNGSGSVIYQGPAIDWIILSNNTFRANRALGEDGAGGTTVGFLDGQWAQVANCTFSNNYAQGGGAGIGFGGGAGGLTAEVWNCVFELNESDTGDAIVTFNTGDGTNRMSNCVFRANTLGGGRVLNLWRTGAIVDNCSFVDNITAGADGSAIYQNCSRLFVMGGGFTNNTGGSAIYVNNANDLYVTNSVFRNNSGEDGGAINLQLNASASIYNSDFVDNNASDDGGAIWANTGDNLDLVCKNVLFGYNQASSEGGAVFYNLSTTRGTFENVTFYGNRAQGGDGGAVRLSPLGYYFWTNCIFYANSAGGSYDNISGAGNAASTNIFGYCNLNTNQVNNTVSVYEGGIINLNPRIVSGGGRDFHLQSIAGHWDVAGFTSDALSSPCIDAGDPSYPWSTEVVPNGGVINMGRYGNTRFASLTDAYIKMTNFVIGVSNRVSDAQVTSGVFSVVTYVYNDLGISNSATLPNFDIINQNGTVILTDQTYAVNTFLNNGQTLFSSNASHQGAAGVDAPLGTNYILRWSAGCSNNAFDMIDQTTTKVGGGGVPTVFTVYDDDDVGPDQWGFTIQGRRYTNDASIGLGVPITGLVQDITSGMYTNMTYFNLYNPDGAHLLTNIVFTNDMAQGGTDAYSVSYLMPSNLFRRIGVYTASVQAADFDQDRPLADDYDVSISNFTFVIAEPGAPRFYDFSVDGTDVTDHQLANGFSVSGRVWDIGSGIVSNEYTPYYYIYNATGTLVVSSNTFAWTPSNGAALFAAERLYDTNFTVEAGTICLGLWTAYVGAVDLYTPPNPTESNMAFTVIDEDTNGPSLSGFGAADRVHRIEAMDPGFWWTGQVQDTVSGVHTSELTFTLISPTGQVMASSIVFTNDASGHGDTGVVNLRYLMPSSWFGTVEGVYTVIVVAADYDDDRGVDRDKAVTTNTYTFRALLNAPYVYESFEEYSTGWINGQGFADSLDSWGWQGHWTNKPTRVNITNDVDRMYYWHAASSIYVPGGARAMYNTNYSMFGSNPYNHTWKDPAFRRLRDTIDYTDNGGVVYISFLAKSVDPRNRWLDFHISGAHWAAPLALDDECDILETNFFGLYSTEVEDMLLAGLGNPNGDNLSDYSIGACVWTSRCGNTRWGYPSSNETVSFLVAKFEADPALGWTNATLYRDPTSATNAQAANTHAIANPAGWTGNLDRLIFWSKFINTDYVEHDPRVIYDEIRIGPTWQSVVPTGAPPDLVGPDIYSFNVDGGTFTDAELVNGFVVSGMVRDADSGILSNATFPHFSIYNTNGVWSITQNPFDVAPANGAQTGAVYELTTISSNQIVWGTGWIVRVTAYDNAGNPNRSVSNFIMNVVDDDTNPPSVYGISVDGARYTNDASIGSGINITGMIQDAVSGIYTTGLRFTFANPNGVLIYDDHYFSNSIPANGDTNAWPIAHLIPSNALEIAGTYTLAIWVSDYDHDHDFATDRATNYLEYPFQVIGRAPYAEAYRARPAGGASNVVLDCDIVIGDYRLQVDISAVNGIVTNSVMPHYDLVSPSNKVLITNGYFGTKIWINKPYELRVRQDSHYGVPPVDNTLGVWTMRWTAATSAGRTNDNEWRLISNTPQIMNVVDDDTTPPDLTGFDMDLYYHDNQNIPVTGLVQDTQSGVSSSGVDHPTIWVWAPTGLVVDGQAMTFSFSDGGASTTAESISFTIPNGDVTALGTWTVMVQAADYDIDRLNDKEFVIVTNTFEVVDDAAITVHNNGGATDVTASNAMLNAQLFRSGSIGQANVRIYWGTADAAMQTNNWENMIEMPGGPFSPVTDFQQQLTGLRSATYYYYRAYAYNGMGETAWAPETATFQTAQKLSDTIVGTYYVPYPENMLYGALATLHEAVHGPGSAGTNVKVIVSIVISSTNTFVYYDHHEDGFEDDITAPLQATTEIWGDGQPINGYPPGFPGDVLGGGDVITLDNFVPNTRPMSEFFFDGGDKFAVDAAVVATRFGHLDNPGVPLGGCTQIFDTKAWGYDYEFPIGTNMQSEYAYIAATVMAGEDGTVVEYDKDRDGVMDQTDIIDEGESANIYYPPTGAYIYGSKPIQVQLITGPQDAAFNVRWYTLFARDQWSDDYWTPIFRNPLQPQHNTTIYMYNPYTNKSITVYIDSLCENASRTIGATNWASYPLPVCRTAYHLYTTDGSTFGCKQKYGSANRDFGTDMLPAKTLTTLLINGYGMGDDREGTVDDPHVYNGMPCWISVPTNATVLIDPDGDPDTGNFLDADRGWRYDYATNLTRFMVHQARDDDYDQTGLRAWTTNGVPLITAWAHEPTMGASTGGGMDMGYTIIPFPTAIPVKRYQLIGDLEGNGVTDPGDTVRFTIDVTRQVFDSLDEVYIFDDMQYLLEYNTNSTTIDGTNILDNTGINTPFPLDENGWLLGVIRLGETVTVSYTATLATNWPEGVNRARNVARVEGQESWVYVPVQAYPFMEIFKSNSPSGLIDRGTNIEYTITLINTQNHFQTYVSLSDPLPVSTIIISNSTRVHMKGNWDGSFRDEFTDPVYDNQDGQIWWESSWVRTDLADATAIRVITDTAFQDDQYMMCIADTGKIHRVMKLDGNYTNVTLTFNFRLEAATSVNDRVLIQLSDDASVDTSWNTVGTIYGGTTDAVYQATNLDVALPLYAVSNAGLRFWCDSWESDAAGSRVWIDDVNVHCWGNYVTNRGGDPPTLFQDYTFKIWQTGIVTFTVETMYPGVSTQIVNEAGVISVEAPVYHYAWCTNPVNAVADLAIRKWATESGSLDMHGFVTYYVTISNSGNVVEQSVTLRDYLPGQLNYVTGSSWNVTHNMPWEPPPILLFNTNLQPGEVVTLLYTSRVVDTGGFTNIARVTTQLRPQGLYGRATNWADNLIVTQGVYHTSGGAQISWTPTKVYGFEYPKDYDVLYVDSPNFVNALSNQWNLLDTVSSYQFKLVDTGQVSGIHPQKLGKNMRFYRVARKDRWQPANDFRLASEEVYVLRNIQLYPGQNWVSLPCVPDSNSLAFVLGTNVLPGGSVASDPYATKVSWYPRTNYVGQEEARLEAQMISDGHWEFTVHPNTQMVGEVADAWPLPLHESFIVEVPWRTNLLVIGRVRTNILPAISSGQHVIPAEYGVTNFALFTMNLPYHLHPSQTGVREGQQGGFRQVNGWPDFVTHDVMWKWRRSDQVVPDYIVYWPTYGGWISLTGYPFRQVANDYFTPDDGIVVMRPNTDDPIYIEEQYDLLYDKPTYDMSP